MSKLTISEIAKRSGVSRTAVSFYLNGKAKQYRIASATINRIEEVINESNYEPNFHARAMMLKKTFIIGLIINDSSFQSFWNKVLSGIESVLLSENYQTLLSISDYSLVKENKLFGFMQRKGVDGIIYAPVECNEENCNWDKILKINEKVPIISILENIEGLCSVYTDNHQGGKIAVKHLHSMGHRKIAYLGPLSENSTSPVNSRFNGAKEFLKIHNVDLPVFNEVPDLMKVIKQFTGVFCNSDFIAGQLYKSCLKYKIKIPEDISVVGYDNMEFTQFFYPELTTVNQDKIEIGTDAARMLIDILKQSPKENNIIIKKHQPKLIRRDSVAKLT
jgi:LacI family transcriptional regulator, galactose operon repressor